VFADEANNQRGVDKYFRVSNEQLIMRMRSKSSFRFLLCSESKTSFTQKTDKLF